jgi:hypothetical protein
MGWLKNKILLKSHQVHLVASAINASRQDINLTVVVPKRNRQKMVIDPVTMKTENEEELDFKETARTWQTRPFGAKLLAQRWKQAQEPSRIPSAKGIS